MEIGVIEVEITQIKIEVLNQKRLQKNHLEDKKMIHHLQNQKAQIIDLEVKLVTLQQIVQRIEEQIQALKVNKIQILSKVR